MADMTAPLEVAVERGRVWIKRAHQSFMLAYDDPENMEWYASRLRDVLGIASMEERYTLQGAMADPGARNPFREGSDAAKWWQRGNAGVRVLRECCAEGCSWKGYTDRMLGAVGPLCPDCGEVTEPIDGVPECEPCPRGGDKPEPTCTNRHQCWEPCGELGNDPKHVRRASAKDTAAIDAALGVREDGNG